MQSSLGKMMCRITVYSGADSMIFGDFVWHTNEICYNGSTMITVELTVSRPDAHTDFNLALLCYA